MQNDHKTIRTAHLLAKKMLDEASRTWHLEFAADAAFSFIPGQFLSILAERTYPATHPRAGQTRIDTRAYSIASAPSGNNFALCINRVDTADGSGHFSSLCCDLAVGSAINFHGPHGDFTLRENPGPVLMLAEETGIAPVRSILQQHKDLSGTLIQATSTSENPLYSDEFLKLSPLDYHPVRDDVTHSASLTAVDQALAAAPAIREAYIVGLGSFVNAHRAHLKELGWDRKQIIFERYD